jgi:hypothetical protein
MSVEQSEIIDIVNVDPRTGHVVLTVSDHLDWSHSTEHFALLQKKLNKYLAFVESGELLRNYPKAKDRPVAFNITFKFKPNEEARTFLLRTKGIIESAGFTLRHEVFADPSEN